MSDCEIGLRRNANDDSSAGRLWIPGQARDDSVTFIGLPRP